MNKKNLFLSVALSLTFVFFSQATKEKLKMYCIYTPSHAVMKDEWFLPSLQDDYEIIMQFFDQECSAASFMSQGWKKTTIHKVELWLQAAKDNTDKIFICSDVDIQFFQPTQKLLEEFMNDNDLVVQQDTPGGGICSGFFACRGNDRTIKLFEAMLQCMKKYADKSDQACLKQFIKKSNPFNIKWQLLPVEFFGGGTLTAKLWKPGVTLPVPQNIVMHHANWTKGITNKIAQLKHVKTVVEQRTLPH